MHELALADAVIRAALAAARREGMARITRVVVRIGELQQTVPGTFRVALEELLPADDPCLSGTRFDFEPEPARFRCRPCDRTFGLAEAGGPRTEREAEAIHFVPELAHGFLACPVCGSPDFDVLQGRGIVLERIEGTT